MDLYKITFMYNFNILLKQLKPGLKLAKLLIYLRKIGICHILSHYGSHINSIIIFRFLQICSDI